MIGILNREEIRLDAWKLRIFPDINTYFDYDLLDLLSQLDHYCSKIDDELGGVGLGSGYISKVMEIEHISDFENSIWDYLRYIPEDIKSKIDDPLYHEFNNALNYIATIDISKINTDNTIGLEGIREVSGGGYSRSFTEKLPSLTLEDFIGSRKGENEGSSSNLFTYTQCVDEFADMFKADYEANKEYLIAGEDEMTLEQYLDSLVIKEFTYKKDASYEQELLQEICDFTVVIPIYEICSGATLVTKDPMSDGEKQQMEVMVAVSVVTLGSGAGNIAKYGFKVGIKMVLADALSNTASNITMDMLDDSPKGIQMMAGLMAGALTGQLVNSNIFKENNILYLNNGLDEIVENPSILKNTTPNKFYKYLKDNGYNPIPLKEGTFKYIQFEEGGGYKVIWNKDRLIQYHPPGGHHGGIQYWKISSGPKGIVRYDMIGNLLK